MELRGANFDWDNWAGLPPDLLAAAKAGAASDGVRPLLAARSLAVLRRRTNPAPSADAGAPVGAGGAGGARGAPAWKAAAGSGPATGAGGVARDSASNGSRSRGHVGAPLPLPEHSGDAGDSDEGPAEGASPGGREWQRRGGSAGPGADGLRQGVEQSGPRRREGSGNLDGGERARGSQRSLGSGTLDGGERERGSRRSLGIGSQRSLEGARRHEVPSSMCLYTHSA